MFDKQQDADPRRRTISITSLETEQFYLAVDGRREWLPFESLKQAGASIEGRHRSLLHGYTVLDNKGREVFSFGLDGQSDH